MIQIVPYKAEHWDNFKPQDAQNALYGLVDQPTREMMEQYEGYTGIVDGEVIGFCGVIEMWPGRAIAWAWLANCLGRKMIFAHRAVEKFLEMYKIGRLEAIVDTNHPAAIRWIEMLGFKRETPEPMQNCLPGGNSAYLYARVRAV